MSQPLPISGFRFLDNAEAHGIDWMAQSVQQPIGYFVECDLDYPAELHDTHNDYPLAVERLNVSTGMLSENQLLLRRNYNMPRSAACTKLIPNFLPKRKYLAHYLLLKFYLEHGLQLKAVHRVIEFKQENWLAQYIDLNTQLRSAAKTDFEKDHFKLMNNSVYGKTCENQKKRTDIKLVVTEQKRKLYTEKPHCLGFRIFNENLAAINMRKITSLIDKPFYVGYSVLELSKLHMYRFHYDVIKAKYGARAELLMTDTDSLVYHIQTENLYEDMLSMRGLYDLANFPKTSKYFDATNNKVIGKFKDETGGEPILEFIGLRPKMYSFLTVHDSMEGVPRIEEKHRAKGITRAASKLLRHQDFLRQLENPMENLQLNTRIGSRLHQLYTIELHKRGLCAFDDKRFLLADGINSLSFVHVKIQNDVVYEEPDEPIDPPHVFAIQPPNPNKVDEVVEEGVDPETALNEARLTAIRATSCRILQSKQDVCFDLTNVIE